MSRFYLRAFSNPSGPRKPTGKRDGSGKRRFPTLRKTRPGMRRPFGTITVCTRPPTPTTVCRWGCAAGLAPAGVKTGLQIDCMLCHGGSIGGQSYVGLGNTQLDLKAVLFELNIADGKRSPFSTFVLNSSRGTNNAGQVAATLLSLRNRNLSIRSFPLPLAVNLPEMDTPPWWHLKRKRTMYYDGRTDVRSVRTNMQFLLGEKTFADLKALEPAFRDVQAFLCSIEPPKYPFPVDTEKAGRGLVVFKANCARCHGTYGPDGIYPNKIIPLETIGTDPARSVGLSDQLIAHYNATWFGAQYPVETKRVGYQAPPLDGIWASAPYLHNGSVPTLQTLLDSSSRPARFSRPPSTEFAHYDTAAVGWKFDLVSCRRTGLDGQTLALSGQVHRRHIAIRHGQSRPHLWRFAERRGTRGNY